MNRLSACSFPARSLVRFSCSADCSSFAVAVVARPVGRPTVSVGAFGGFVACNNYRPPTTAMLHRSGIGHHPFARETHQPSALLLVHRIARRNARPFQEQQPARVCGRKTRFHRHQRRIRPTPRPLTHPRPKMLSPGTQAFSVPDAGIVEYNNHNQSPIETNFIRGLRTGLQICGRRGTAPTPVSGCTR